MNTEYCIIIHKVKENDYRWAEFKNENPFLNLFTKRPQFDSLKEAQADIEYSLVDYNKYSIVHTPECLDSLLK